MEYFDQAMSYGNLRRGLNRAARDVRWKDSVVGYELHGPQNTHKNIREIRDGTYTISPYQVFTIHEPKTREIVATRIKDRQVQMALCEGGFYRDMAEHFIYDNSACQTGKGTDFALDRMRKHLREFYQKHGRNGWVLKCDVHHFFPETRHDVAKAAVAKRCSDPKAAQMVFDVIDSFGGEKGIGLGSQISQLVELAVLDDLDHFIKERLRIRHYVRYMDDLILIHESREKLKECREAIGAMLNAIGLELNEKTTMYPLKQGVKFLQWRFILTESGKIVQKMSSAKMGRQRRRLKKLLAREMNGEIPEGTAENSLQAWKANAARGDTYFQQKRMTEFYYSEKARIRNGKHFTEAAQSGAGREERAGLQPAEPGRDRLQRHDGQHRGPVGGRGGRER